MGEVLEDDPALGGEHVELRGQELAQAFVAQVRRRLAEQLGVVEESLAVSDGGVLQRVDQGGP
ncbi:hypothetical protein ACIRRH_42365 [Kitasatospora sp. NPDC101235]|uniref:hypothetical protein n=1 Tax=Kitasatospora sp. NPDC101235 TaxID=3364101 RepID=UPI0037FC2A6B